ncbi:MAG: hypothetical protein R3C45_04200 [Phycisphaerales bacterium]
MPKTHSLYRRYDASWRQIARIGARLRPVLFLQVLPALHLLGHPIRPHRRCGFLVLQRSMGEANVVGTDFCCECNLCTMIACPEDLDPKNVCTPRTNAGHTRA